MTKWSSVGWQSLVVCIFSSCLSLCLSDWGRQTKTDTDKQTRQVTIIHSSFGSSSSSSKNVSMNTKLIVTLLITALPDLPNFYLKNK